VQQLPENVAVEKARCAGQEDSWHCRCCSALLPRKREVVVVMPHAFFRQEGYELGEGREFEEGARRDRHAEARQEKILQAHCLQRAPSQRGNVQSIARWSMRAFAAVKSPTITIITKKICHGCHELGFGRCGASFRRRVSSFQGRNVFIP